MCLAHIHMYSFLYTHAYTPPTRWKSTIPRQNHIDFTVWAIARAHTQLYACMHACIQTYRYIQADIDIYTRMHPYMHAYKHTYMHVDGIAPRCRTIETLRTCNNCICLATKGIQNQNQTHRNDTVPNTKCYLRNSTFVQVA